jgi:hypothetical protein
MADATVLMAALVIAVCGMAWLALAKKPHWAQVRGAEALAPGAVLRLQALGAIAQLGSLVLCLRADHVSMASLVWVMTMAAAALLVAFTLAYRPHWLSWLVLWVRSS